MAQTGGAMFVSANLNFWSTVGLGRSLKKAPPPPNGPVVRLELGLWKIRAGTPPPTNSESSRWSASGRRATWCSRRAWSLAAETGGRGGKRGGDGEGGGGSAGFPAARSVKWFLQ